MINTFGDSHSKKGYKNITDISLNLHHIGPILSYSFGNENLNRINISDVVYNVKENDYVIFCLGEIDCRCHIYKHISLNNDYKKIISNITDKYIEAVNINKNLFKNIKVGIMSVVPPVDSSKIANNPKFPFLGTNEERIKYTKYFNKCLHKLCLKNNIIFIDIYDKYSNHTGLFNDELKDKNVHIKNPIYLREELIKKFNLKI